MDPRGKWVIANACVSSSACVLCSLEKQAPLLQKPKLEKRLAKVTEQAEARAKDVVGELMPRSLELMKLIALLAAQRAQLVVRTCF